MCSHHRLRQSQLLRERIARERGAFLRGIEEVADEAARRAGIGTGTKREQEKGDVESWYIASQSAFYPSARVRSCLTPEFELVGAASQQLLDLVRRDFSPLISVGPLRLGRRLLSSRLLGGFLAGSGVFAPEHTREKRHCRWSRHTRTPKMLDSEN